MEHVAYVDEGLSRKIDPLADVDAVLFLGREGLLVTTGVVTEGLRVPRGTRSSTHVARRTAAATGTGASTWRSGDVGAGHMRLGTAALRGVTGVRLRAL